MSLNLTVCAAGSVVVGGPCWTRPVLTTEDERDVVGDGVVNELV